MPFSKEALANARLLVQGLLGLQLGSQLTVFVALGLQLRRKRLVEGTKHSWRHS